MGQNIDEWIRFFNVKTEGDLDMLRMQTNNAGILEAIKEVEHMSLSRWAKAQYEEHMKRVMDRKAEDAYVFDRGVERGIEQGIEQGNVLHLIGQVCKKMKKGKTVTEIAEDLEEPAQKIEQIYKAALKYNANEKEKDKIYAELN